MQMTVVVVLVVGGSCGGDYNAAMQVCGRVLIVCLEMSKRASCGELMCCVPQFTYTAIWITAAHQGKEYNTLTLGRCLEAHRIHASQMQQSLAINAAGNFR